MLLLTLEQGVPEEREGCSTQMRSCLFLFCSDSRVSLNGPWRRMIRRGLRAGFFAVDIHSARCKQSWVVCARREVLYTIPLDPLSLVGLVVFFGGFPVLVYIVHRRPLKRTLSQNQNILRSDQMPLLPADSSHLSQSSLAGRASRNGPRTCTYHMYFSFPVLVHAYICTVGVL